MLAGLVAVLAGSFAGAVPAAACQVCFGDPNSSLTRGVEMGVWFLLAVILLVQAGFGIFFFVYLRRRTRGIRIPMPRPVLHVVKKGV
ncbi:MAG TPA: hypothetical protein VL049_21855 [Candidatus Dormibacteraeota bacterium]|nr:hypothetical protein [Candidatus Dormibacteraeota bacterium]